MTVSIVVQKYGGSSVADADRIRKVARRVVDTRDAGHQVCVVVSAMGKTTDQLLGLARDISEAPPRREMDMLLSCGERISMALLSMAIQELGAEAISFTGSQCGIMTNDRHSGARIIEVRPVRVQDELERGAIVIVAGFQGVSYKREITTLGRGGSDTTAVALAAALGAEYCEICSDVDGVYTADPRVVGAARLQDAISHDAMEELASHGAKVLHPAAVEFARASGIALYARATASPAVGAGGTRVGGPTTPGGGAAGITGQKGLVWLGVGRSERGPALVRLTGALAAANVPAQHVRGGDDRADAVLMLDNVPDWPRAREALQALDLAVERDVGSVSVVGDGIGSDPHRVASIVEAAGAAGHAPLDLYTSPLRVSLVCEPDHVDALVTLLHDAVL